jgi:hypothetical protein
MPIAKNWSRSYFLATLCAVVLAPSVAHADSSITGISPDRAPMQSLMTIYGSDFGNSQGTGYVTIGGRAVPVLGWSPSAIHVVVNPLAYIKSAIALDTTYPVQVITERGSVKSNTMDFTLMADALPTLADIVDPTSLSDQPSFECFQRSTLFCRGDSVIFYGSGFGFSQGTGFVTINIPVQDSHGNVTRQDFALPVLSWSENAVFTVLNLPDNVVPGAWTITVHRGNGKTASGTLTGGMISNGACTGGTPPVVVGPPQVTLGGFTSQYFHYISFADLKINTTAGPLCFTITNTGTGPLNINNISILNCSNSVEPHYVDCSTIAGLAIVSGGQPGTLAPGEARTVCLTFMPHEAATYSATVMIASNDPAGPATVTLHGTGDN